MKKLIASIFVAVLAFVSFGAPQAMAAGNSNADVISKNGKSYNTIKVTKSLHNSPADTSIVNYVSPVQDVHIKRAYFKIETWLGPKWVIYLPESGGGYNDTLHYAFDAANAKLKVETTLALHSSATGTGIDGAISPQTVNVYQVWYQIDTWLGPKWIGYNM